MPDIDATLGESHESLEGLLEQAEDLGPMTNKKKGVRIPTGPPMQDVLDQLEQYRDDKGNQNGRPRSTRRNLYKVLKQDRRWKKKIWLDEFKGTMMLCDREYRDTDDTRTSLWVDAVYDFKVSPGVVSEVARLVSEENGRNPLTEALLSLAWDGQPRIDRWLVDGVGAEDNELNSQIGRRWLISAVARAMQPGCKSDTVLILVGPQGAKKSTAFRVLASDRYFCDTPMDFGSVNAYIQIERTWVYEVAELDSVRRSAHSSVKAFLTAQEDTYRPPYGRHAITVPRHCVFCGTTNEHNFISDPTGSRRFWPVRVGSIDLKWIHNNRLQIWAEATHAYQAGERWWLEDVAETELKEVSQDYRLQDPWFEIVKDWLIGRMTREVRVREVLEDCLKLEKNHMTRASEMRIAEIMRELGYERQRKSVNNTRAYYWSRPGTVTSLPSVTEDSGYE